MYRRTYKLTVALLTFAAGVALVWAFASVWKLTRPPEFESPPCQSCAAFYSSGYIPNLSLCELAVNPERYVDKLVRVRAAFVHDAGQVNLRARECGETVGIHAGLSNSFGSCAGAHKVLTIYTGFGTWYDGTTNVVVVVGRVGRLENPTLFADGKLGFNIVCLMTVALKS